MNKLTTIIASGAVAVMAVLSASADPYVTDTNPPTPGVWNSNFASSKAYAENNDIPFLVYWGSKSCPKCSKLKSAICQSDFLDWQAKRKLVMVLIDGTATSDAASCKAYAKNSSLEWPYISIAWRGVQKKFTGRSGVMLVSGGTLQKQLMNSVESVITGWNPDGSVDPQPVPPTPVKPVVGPEWGKSRTLCGAICDGEGRLEGVLTVKAGRVNSKGLAKLSVKVTNLLGKSQRYPSVSVKVDAKTTYGAEKYGNRLAITLEGSTLGGNVSTGTEDFRVETMVFGGVDNDGVKAFVIDDALPANIQNLPVLDRFIPRKYEFNSLRSKWDCGKTGRVVVRDGDFVASNANPSALKLKYVKSTGKVSGSFKIYLKKSERATKTVTAKITGFYAPTVGGFGLIQISKVGSYYCTIVVP